jgi:hypothetical protein
VRFIGHFVVLIDGAWHIATKAKGLSNGGLYYLLPDGQRGKVGPSEWFLRTRVRVNDDLTAMPVGVAGEVISGDSARAV